MQRYRVFYWLGPLLAASLFSIAFLEPDSSLRPLSIGYFLGSLFAHPTLAAAWTALGPGPLIWRVPLSILWVLLLPLAIAVNVSLNGGPSNAAFMLGACFLGQWAALQVPLWAIAWGFGIRLQQGDDMESKSLASQYRFGIRHLLIIMVIVSVVLGIGRLVVPHLAMSGSGEVEIFIFLVVAAVVVTLPLMLAALMRRLAIVGVLLALLLVVLGTIVEFPLFNALGGNGPKVADFIAINTFSSLLVLIVAGIVRLHGYCLYARGSAVEA